MKKPKNPLTLVLTFGLWLGLVLGCKTSTRRTSEATNAITISAEDLYRAYESNEAEADKLYRGKIVIVTGKVGIIDAKIPLVFLMDAQQKPNIKCDFARDQKDAVSKLEFGQTVTVKGKCAGKVLGSVGLIDCVLQRAPL